MACEGASLMLLSKYQRKKDGQDAPSKFLLFTSICSPSSLVFRLKVHFFLTSLTFGKLTRSNFHPTTLPEKW